MKAAKGGKTQMKFLLALITSVMLITTAAQASAPYVASVLREPFHRVSCRWAAKIAPENAVYYETRDQAIADGHRPCKVCKP